MDLTFGKYRGVALEHVLLTNPDYIDWMRSEDDPTPLLRAARTEARLLVRIFDRKPFVEKCHSTKCANTATRGTVHGANIQLVCWCAGCNPYQLGADDGRLQIVSRFDDVSGHVAFHCNGREQDYRRLVRNLAEAKGLMGRVTRESALEFFGTC